MNEVLSVITVQCMGRIDDTDPNYTFYCLLLVSSFFPTCRTRSMNLRSESIFGKSLLQLNCTVFGRGCLGYHYLFQFVGFSNKSILHKNDMSLSVIQSYHRGLL